LIGRSGKACSRPWIRCAAQSSDGYPSDGAGAMRDTMAFLITPASLCAVALGFGIFQSSAIRPELAGLDFEAEHSGSVPKGWNGGPAGTFAVDGQTVHGGKWALRIERNEKSEGAFSAVNRNLPIDFAGESLELRGFLRTEGVSNFAGLWMREDSG